ncbi:MAG: ABC transporter ATP-binding protein [Oscillospiraceae bacterium]
MKHIVKHVKPYLGLLAASIILLAAQAYCNLMLPNIMSQIVNVGIQGYTQKIAGAGSSVMVEALKAEQLHYIYTMGAKMLILAVITSLIALSVQLCNARLGTGVGRDLRKTIFTKIESFSSQEFDQFSTASLITRTTNDVQQVQQMLTMGIRIIVFAPFMGIGGVVMALNKAPSMAWINVLSVILVIGLISVIYTFALPKFKIIQALVDRLNLVARESLQGLMVVRAFSKQKYEQERFDVANEEYKNNNLYVNRIMSVMGPSTGLLQTMVPVVIIWAGAAKIAQSRLLVGDMMAFIQYSGNIMEAFMMISQIFVMIPRAMVSVNRIAEILDKENTIVEKSQPTFVERGACKVQFKNVYFSYPNSQENALEDINFTAMPGQTTAIIGSTGCGKTSVLNLIPRLYDVTSGQVLINGVDVRDMGIENLRDLVGTIPQKSVLFSGTIRSNMLVGKADATDEEIEEATAISQAKTFVEANEQKYEALISQGGTNVSGGQKQRLSIARAIIKKAPIYIFDDSFSALDFTTDLNLRKALNHSLSGSTIIIVGQRVASIMNADSIIVMDKGRIVGKGTHKELLESCEEYKEIAYSQLSKEEV